MLRIVNRMSINMASRALAVRFGSSGPSDKHGKHGHDGHGHAKHGHGHDDHHDHHHNPEEMPLPAREVHEGKVVDPNMGIPDVLGHAVGLERYELLKELEGDQDPFMTSARTEETRGTKEKPTLVPSNLKSRTIGCECTPGMKNVRYLYVYRGNPQRCYCGNWYALCTPEEYYEKVKGKQPKKAIHAH